MEQDFEQQEKEYLKLQENQNKAKAIIDELSDCVNKSSWSEKHFIEAFKRDHRTLQQGMFKLFLQVIEEVASDNYHTDLRNQASKEVAKALLEGFKMVKKKQYISEGTSEERAESYVSGDGEKPSRYLPCI